MYRSNHPNCSCPALLSMLLCMKTGRLSIGEIALSIPYRAAQVLLIGVDPQILFIWQTFLLLSIMFHHSNVQLPKSMEDRLVRFTVTPSMHGIHHSKEPRNQNWDWSGGLILWDALHRTLNLRRNSRQVAQTDHNCRIEQPLIVTSRWPLRDLACARFLVE
jgi:sterol desaturase/sphingolipid hydroxylase (fatty acid hydroxylase superfamily)